MAAGWPHGDPHEVARAIVASPRFHGTTSSAPPDPSLFERFSQWLGGLVRDLFRAFDHVLGANHPLARILGIAVVLAAIALVAWIVFRLVTGYLQSLPPRRAPLGTAAISDAAQSAEQLARAASAAMREGRLRDAARLYFTAALRLLDERGIVTFDAARTPGEYRRLVRRRDFDALVRDAVGALFDEADPAPETLERISAAYGALRAADGA